MKKGKCFIVLFSLLFLMSCADSEIINDEAPVSKTTENNLLSVKPIVNAVDYENQISDWNNTISKNAALTKSYTSNDLSLVEVSYMPEVDIILVKNNGDNASYTAYYRDSKEIINELNIAVEKIEDGSCLINYKYFDGSQDKLRILADGTLGRPKTKDTMSCIEDAYSNHGWASVWVFVQTAFIPATAAGIAVACVAHNL